MKSSVQIETKCPHCGATYEVSASDIYNNYNCKVCSKEYVVKLPNIENYIPKKQKRTRVKKERSPANIRGKRDCLSDSFARQETDSHRRSNNQNARKDPYVTICITLVLFLSVWGIYSYYTRDKRVYHEALEQYREKKYEETLAIMQPLSTEFKSRLYVKRVEADCCVNVISNLISRKKYKTALQKISELPSDIFEKDTFEQLKKGAASLEELTKQETQESKLYRVVDKEDFSYRAPNGQLFVLKDYRILLLSTDATSNQIQNIAKNIATNENNVSALNVYFFWPDTEKAGAYTAAMATYAPNGRWDDFQKNSPKELVMKYGRAKAESTPQRRSDTEPQPASSSRKKIYRDLVNEEDRAGIAGDYEQCKQFIAKRYGLSVSEVAKIQVEGVDNRWPIPEDPVLGTFISNRKNDTSISASSGNIRTSGDTTGAWVGMTYFVKDRLKSPSSAKFEYAGARNVIKLDNDRYRIRSYVDAQNAFGSPIRMRFEGVVRKTSSSWALEELNIDE